MKNLYKIIILLTVLFAFQGVYAQKTLKMQVTNVNTNKNTDCDGLNDSDFEWRWFNGGSELDCAYYGGNNGPIGDNTVRDLYSGIYWSADCWGNGIGTGGSSMTITLRVAENDETFGSCNSGSYCIRTDGTTVPAYNSAIGNTVFANNTGVDCNNGCDAPYGGAANLNYKHTLRWNVAGSYSGNNLDGNGYTTNKTCATAIALTTDATGTLRTNDVNQCTDVWYTYTVTSTNLTSLTFGGANGTVSVYVGSCSSLCSLGSGSNSYAIGGPVPPGTYYVRVSANGSRTNMVVSRTTGTNNNDYIAAATNLGAMPAGGGTLASNNDNFGTSQESGEPGLADNHTDWFYFTTDPSTVPAYVDIKVDGSYGSTDLDADFKLYKLNATDYAGGYQFPRACVPFSKLEYKGEGDGDNNVACRVNGTFESSLESYNRFCLEPNSKYYIQVAGWRNNDTWPCDFNEWEGNYRITVTGSTTAKGKDNVCDAHDFGTLAANSSTGNIYYNNSCATTQVGEQRLGDMSNTIWYKFTTPATGLTGVNINIEEAGEGANYVAGTLYLKSTGACSGTSGLTEVAFDRWCGSDGGTFSAECLLGGRDYYLQVGTGYNFALCTDILNGGRSAGRIKVNISSYNASNGQDNVCSSDNLGTYASYTGSNLTFTRTNHSNRCATTQANEPSGGQKTTWYSFTTGAVVGRELYVKVDAKTNGMDAEVYIYEACNPPICTGAALNGGELNELANYWDGLLVPAFGFGEWDAEGTLTGVIQPNTTYYIRVDGVNLYGPVDGEYDLTVRMQGGLYNGNDNFCNAWTVGASNSPGGSGAAHTESIANNDILDLGETISVPTFNNKQASSQEACALDEPNNDEDDETVWFKVTTGSNPGTEITVDVDAINDGSGGLDCIGGLSYGWVKAYKADGSPVLPINCAGWITSTNWFDGITEAGSDDAIDASKYYIKCPMPNTTYYIQVENQGLGCDKSSFTMTVKDNGRSAGPDRICDALDLGTAPYGGPLSNMTNVDLFINNQSNACASTASGEPDPFPAQSIDKTVWYKFTTPAAYYPSGNPLAQLPHVYTFEVDRLSSSASTSWPTFAVYEQTAVTSRVCTPENSASFSNLALVDYTQNLDFGDASIEYLCLKPSTTYYIQIDHASTPWTSEYVDFSLRIKKAAFRAADNLCDAFDLGIITADGTASGTPTGVNWTNSGKMSAAPMFSLPHTNKCTAAENGENDVANPGNHNEQEANITGGGTHTATTWYKFTTGNTVPDWIYWYNDDRVGSDANRGTGCLELIPYGGGVGFNTEVTFIKPESPSSCPVHTQMVAQPEMNIPGDVCDAVTGIGFGAPCYNDLFRLKCPLPNTTYYVQIKDMGFGSLCFEGVWSYDNGTYGIKTAPTLGGAPANDSICNAIDLGSVPNGGTLAPSTIYDNFCATPDLQWRGDFSQPLEADVWFRFKPPVSGSVLITAQSAPAGSPGIDDDLDLQMAIWEPILGDGTNLHCSDPRYLWTPIIAQDHKDCELTEASISACSGLNTNVLFAYDIYKTCGGSFTCNEGNSFIATCLDPNKYYYLQVDGGDYATCDLFDAGDCVMGYFKLQIQDAGLSLVNPANTAAVISPYTSLGIRNFEYLHDEPCFAYHLGTAQNAALDYGSLNWTKMTNRCATSIGDPLPSQWGARNTSTDKTVWATFIAPPTGKVRIRAENIAQIKGDDDYHQDINLQLAVYQTSNCYDKWRLTEVQSGFGFDGACIETDITNSDDGIRVCVPVVNPTCGFDEYMTISCLEPGEVYYIMIDGDASYVSQADFEDVEGDFRISVQELSGIPSSSNDMLCDAAIIGGVNTLPVNGSITTGSYSNSCATIEPNIEGAGKIAEKIRGSYQDNPADLTTDEFTVEHSLWFKFQAPASGKVRIEALQEVDDIDLGVAVYDIPNQTCGGLETNGFTITEDYDPPILGGQDEDLEVYCLIPNRWYWIQVDGDRNTTCGPITTMLCSDPLRSVVGGTGSDCETGQFKLKITHLAADPTYISNVDYTPNPDLLGGNDNYCEAHRVRGASGNINIFSNATYLQNGETITFRHNNRCATTEVNEPELNGWDLNPFDSDNTPTVWYVFNTGPILPPLLPGEITINVTNPSGTCFDPDMDLYEYTGPLNSYYTAAGCTNLGANKFNRLYRVGEGSNIPYLPSIRPERITLTCPKPMTTYLIRIAGSSACPLFGDNMGDFDISISMSATPGLDVFNDDICGADNMGTLPYGGQITKLGNNFCATQQQGEPNTSQNCVQSEPCADETVWFKFRTSANPGDIEIVVRDVLALSYIAAPSIAVYRYVGTDNSCTANPFSNLAKLDENSGVVVLAGVQIDSAKVSIPCARPNTWYYVQVDGIDMSLLGFTLPGSSDNFAFNLQVRDLGNYSNRAGNDNLANAFPMDSTITAPTAYVLPAGGTKSRKGHNICATCEDGEDGNYCGINETGHTAAFNAEDETVWYYFTTPSKPGKITVTVADDPAHSGTFSPAFRLYYYNQNMGSPQFRTTNAPSRKLIQEGAGSSGIGASTSVTYTCLLPNTKYYIEVDGNDNVPFTLDQSYFMVTISDDNSGNPGPSNDLICSAENLSTNMASAVNRTNNCSWEETGEPNTSGNMGGTGDDVTSNGYDETVWFTFVPTASQSVRMQLDVTSGMWGGINYRLYEMPSTATITCTGSPANVPTWSQLKEIANGSSTLLVGNEIDETWPCLSPTKRYYIQIDGNNMIGVDDIGDFDIQLTNSNQTTPLNDDICGIGATPGSFPSTSTSGNFGTIGNVSSTKAFNNQNNTCATQQVNEPETNGPLDDITNPSYDHTLWYKFVASNTDGTYNISITNNGGSDAINGYIGLFRQNDDGNPVCPSTSWNAMSKVKETSSAKVANDVTLNLECWEIEEGMTYYFQVQGIDGLLGGDVGNNFNVSVQFIAGTTNPADNICTAPTAIIGTTYSADNRCATTQPNEPNLDPNPQTPLDGKSYDETLWYKFVAPASGEVRLSLSNFSIPILLSVNLQLYEAPTGYNCSVNHFNGLIPNESASLITSISPSTDFRCLAPGKTYYIQFDGNDAFTDRGTWDFVITNLYSANTPPANDEPCGAIDVTQHIRSAALGPCSDDGQYYTETYSIADLAIDIDQATKTATAIGCNGELNCNDYWFKFTVPLDASGIRIQGNDEYAATPGFNNSDEHIGIYRAPSGCGGALQQINCGSGGFNNDVDMTVAAYPGETLYLQVFDANAPANPSRTTFGFCLSVDCKAKLPCNSTADIGYDQPQCWNLNTNGVDHSPIYYDCMSETNNSVNYFTFRTDCDGTPNDTVQVIFSLTELGCGKTAMSIVSDNTPCTPDFQDILVNCAVFQEVLGGTTSTNFNQTYILPGCTNYIVQIIGDNNTAACASAGQILFVRGNTPTTVLPIELLSFTGYNDGDVNVLNWVTASERNSAKFEIEKSSDASTFEYIGEVPAAGNSIIELGYNFIDPNPQFGDNYYRLKMIDSDGTFKYSEIINIKVREDNMGVQDGIIKIYPNPTNGYLNIQYQSSRDNNLDLQIFDMLGKNMLSKTEHVSRGMNIIQVNAFSFAKAMYVLKLIDQFNGNEHQAKFIKE